MNSRRIGWLICVLLAVLTLAAYWRVLGNQFVNYDDDQYVTANRWVKAGPTLQAVRWAFTSGYASNWHPLTWMSHMLDCKLYGMHPFGHHLTSLILHILSAMLLFLLIRRMTGSTWRSAFVAALFAVHPLHVESVAWVAERKDVLSTFLLMLTLHAYVSYVRRPGRGWYLLTLGLFTLGLMAKPMLVSVPFILLLLDCWPLGRFTQGKAKADRMVPVRRLALEKIPFIALAVASCAVTFIVQQKGESVVSADRISIGPRAANALVSYVVYLAKTIWPARLCVFYPHPVDSLPVWMPVGSAVLLVAITILVLRAARTRSYLAVGWLWYVITLVPVIGLVQVGQQAMADRYTYVPLVGIFVALAWGCTSTSMSREPTRPRALMLCLSILVIAACTAGTWHQTGYWKDGITLFQHAIDVTKRNYVAEVNLGIALSDEKRYEESIAHQKAALRIKPTEKPYNNIGVVLIRMGKYDEARPYVEKSLAINPDVAIAQYNMGYLLFKKKRYDEAGRYFRRAINLDHDYADPHHYLAWCLASQGEIDEAIRHYREALAIDPQRYLTHYNLGVLYNGQGDYERAVEEYRATVGIKSNYSRAYHNMGNSLDGLGKTNEAMSEYREAIRLNPNLGAAHNNLAIDLYMSGRYADAWKEVDLARKCRVKVHPGFLKALSQRSK